ncbi:MAG: hypothetical protein MJH10_21030, partial [Epibacterium sp.]|nr:hypothetical protein [Epibacterium sp.]
NVRVLPKCPFQRRVESIGMRSDTTLRDRAFIRGMNDLNRFFDADNMIVTTQVAGYHVSQNMG